MGSVTGRIVADSADSFVVSLSTVRRRDGDETSWRGERVSIGRPLVIDGLMYVLARNNSIVALDAATGKQKQDSSAAFPSLLTS